LDWIWWNEPVVILPTTRYLLVSKVYSGVFSELRDAGIIGGEILMTALEKYENQFRERTKKSKELYEKARTYLPSGVAGRAWYGKPYPLYLRSGKGSKIVDVDGNEYIDFLMGSGAILLGHSPQVVVEAVKEQLEHGTQLIAGTEASIEVAKKICHDVPGMDKVGFVNSGSEAVHMAMRVARAYTGKPKVARIEGHYHGQLDSQLISVYHFAGPEERPEPYPDSIGIDKSCWENVLILPFNNVEASVSLIREHAEELAGVIMEPMAGGGIGSTLADPAYMEALRKVTKEEGILLIWDEVITGFRLSLAGAAPYFKGIIPDLRTLGKVIGGGFPIGVYGGTKEVMEKVVRHELPGDEQTIWQSGTFSGNIFTMVAALTTITYLENEDPYPYLNSLGERIRKGWAKIACDLGIKVDISGVASIARIAFIDKPVKNLRDYSRRDKLKEAVYKMGLLANGMFPNNMEHLFVSAAHSNEDIDKFLDVSEKILKDMKTSG
jgi:glutamate-1-semialdehyde 2,1-aminomutase